MKERLTPIVQLQMESELSRVSNPIFVFVGMEDYVDISVFEKYIVDKDSFAKNGNKSIFDQTWFTHVFTELNNAQGNTELPYTILSFPQFSYLINYIQPDFFKSRIILVRDGFRSLLPLNKEDYIERSGQENIEERNEAMPIYMAEQVQIGERFYYSIKTPLDEFKTINVFNEQKGLGRLPQDNVHEVVDTVSDPYGMDLFINRCLTDGEFNKEIIVKIFQKQPLNQQAKIILEKVNWLLGLFGGQLYELDEVAIKEEFQPSEETDNLLRQYWGNGASFRELKVYKNPDYGKEILGISQGLIVETIINEYKNAKAEKEVKDLFLTAPTGAGKSLLFQLPAFYVSSQNDVTIVVSPLIALMKDQVEQIWNERGFRKAHYLNSDLSLIDREKVIESCKEGEIDLLYLSPELLLSYDITYFIGEERKLGLLVIDEAHLITTWGRDFRVDYWFLGQHINKIRKNRDYRFPMVAVTATAIYGGDNDMVFDSVNSLYMHDPHIFIGEVKRNNITFVVDNHDRYKSNYDSEKEKQTTQFIEAIAGLGVKTIVYAPYRKHIDSILQRLDADGKGNCAVGYHSGMSTDYKNLAYSSFKNNQAKVMISTKAFGMGVDIPDIQLVYHHAPSGLLPDYVQEVGRAARKPEINGFAALSYAIEDQRYSKKLHGMSALRHYQIREVLNKINKMYIANGKQRNMLVSSDDFSYIFDNTADYDQKVMTSLMMIEKDYLAKCRFNVLIARPKKLFVKVYCRVNQYGLELLKQKYDGCYTELRKITRGHTVVQLDLDKIWRRNFSDRSFPVLKVNFYKGKLLKDGNAECEPQVKLTFSLETDFREAYNSLERVLNAIQMALVSLRNHFFSQEELEEKLGSQLTNANMREKVVKFLLATYSGRMYGHNQIEDNAFLQRRLNGQQDEEYRVFNSHYRNKFASLKKLMQRLFENVQGRVASRYTSCNGQDLLNYIRLGSLLEILGMGTYESRGGNNPMIFIRINDPKRINQDAADVGYINSILANIEKRYNSSSELFDHFFLNSFKNEDRWNLIEDFFLGESNDELIARYPAGEKNHIDIISYVKNHIKSVECTEESNQISGNGIPTFPPREHQRYTEKDLLTIDTQTKRVGKWLTEDPVELDKVRREHKLSFDPDLFKVLMSKLKIEHFPYYRDVLGLKLQIDFPGYDTKVVARIPYQDSPVKFYRWWRRNEDKICMNKQEMIQLLIKVKQESPQTLIKKHQKMLEDKKI